MSTLPGCMMPDGADPCDAFKALQQQLAERDAALARCVEALKAAEAAIMDEVCASSGEDHPVINAHAKIAEKARKVLASLPTSAQATAKVQQWRPIETAPKEMHKHYLLFGDGPSIEDCAYVGYLTDVWGPQEWRDITGRNVMKPTHWMPLPEPPEAIREEQEGK